MNISPGLSFSGRIEVQKMDKMMQVIDPDPGQNLLSGVLYAQQDVGPQFPKEDVVEVHLPEKLYGGDVLVKYKDQTANVTVDSLRQSASPIYNAIEAIVNKVMNK